MPSATGEAEEEVGPPRPAVSPSLPSALLWSPPSHSLGSYRGPGLCQDSGLGRLPQGLSLFGGRSVTPESIRPPLCPACQPLAVPDWPAGSLPPAAGLAVPLEDTACATVAHTVAQAVRRLAALAFVLLPLDPVWPGPGCGHHPGRHPVHARACSELDPMWPGPGCGHHPRRHPVHARACSEAGPFCRDRENKTLP